MLFGGGVRGRQGPRSATRWVLVAVATLAVAALPARALAHSGEPPAPHDLWTAWTWDPSILLPLVLGAWLYWRGVRALWTRAGTGRGVRVWRAACFAGGLVAIALALISPLDALDDVLFSAHMAQHLLLMIVAAPLLVLGEPVVAFLWALPPEWRRKVGRFWRRATGARAAWRLLTHPLVAWLLAAAAMWAWHAPALYEAAIESGAIHALEHACFLGTSLLFWWTVVHSGRRRTGYGAGLLSVFAMAVQSGALGALITFAARPWYPVYAPYTAAWGLTPLEDQQLAGLIMWIPAGAIYFLAAAALFVAMLAAAERRARRREAARSRPVRPLTVREPNRG